MIISNTIDRVALVAGIAIAAVIVWIGYRDGEPLLIVAGPALLFVAALIRGGAAGSSAGPSFAPPGPRPDVLLRPTGSGGAPGAISAEVAALVMAGKKIPAIKQYRQETGVGLREAKDAVEAFEFQQPR